jgi:hypothetical protein
MENKIMPEKHSKVMGPVDYLMVRFPGNKFSGKIVPEIVSLEKKGIIRVIDAVLILKDAKGKTSITELNELKGDTSKEFQALAKETEEWLSIGDIDFIAESLTKNSSAAVLLYENVWAIGFKKALLDADAELIDMGRIAPEVIAQVQKNLSAKGGK